MQPHILCVHAYARKLTCGHAHTTRAHTHHSFVVSGFSVCCPTWMLMQPEEHGKERQRAVKSISPHCGSGWQGSTSTHWGPVRYTHTHTTNGMRAKRRIWLNLHCGATICWQKFNSNPRSGAINLSKWCAVNGSELVVMHEILYKLKQSKMSSKHRVHELNCFQVFDSSQFPTGL